MKMTIGSHQSSMAIAMKFGKLCEQHYGRGKRQEEGWGWLRRVFSGEFHSCMNVQFFLLPCGMTLF